MTPAAENRDGGRRRLTGVIDRRQLHPVSSECELTPYVAAVVHRRRLRSRTSAGFRHSQRLRSGRRPAHHFRSSASASSRESGPRSSRSSLRNRHARPTSGPGSRPSSSMIALPSRSGRTRARSSGCRELGDPLLEGVVGRRERGRPLLVARRGVRAHELVQPGEQVAGVGDVTAHRGVGPLAAAVAVEAQVQEGQPGDRLDDVLRVPQRGQPLAHQLRPDHLVVVEGDPPARLVASGRRLADVVQQRRQPQHQVGRPCRPDPPSPGRSPGRARSASACRRPCAGGARRSPSAAPSSSGRTTSASPVCDEQLQRGPRRVLQQRLRQLHLHALGRDPGQLARHRRHRLDDLGRPASGPSWATKRTARSIRSGSSAKESTAEPGRPQPAGQQVAEPAERVGDRPVRAEGDRHRVHREVAAHQVVDQRRRPRRPPGCATPGRSGRPGRW